MPEARLPAGATARLGSPRFRVKAAVDSLALSPDGSRLACTDREGILYILDSHSGEVVGSVKEAFLSHVAFCPEGSALGCVCNDGTQRGARFQGVNIRDPADGRLIRSLAVPHGVINCFVFLPESNRVVFTTSRSDARPDLHKVNKLRLWNWREGREIASADVEPQYGIAVGRNARLFAVGGGENGFVQLRDAVTTKLVWQKEVPITWPRSIAVEARRNTIAIGGKSNRVELLEAETGKAMLNLVHSRNCHHLCFSPDGRLFATATEDGTLSLWALPNGDLLHRWKARFFGGCVLTFTWDSRRLFSGTEDGCIQQWLVPECIPATPMPIPTSVQSVAWLGKSEEIITASGDEIIRKWSFTETNSPENWRSVGVGGQTLAATRDGKRFAAGSGDGIVTVWRGDGSKPQTKIKHGTDRILALALAPDGSVVASSSWDERIILWDTYTGELKRVLQGHSASVIALAWSPDGGTLASAANGITDPQRQLSRADPFNGDRTVRVWEAASGKLLFKRTPPCVVDALAFSPDATILALAGADGVLRIWNSSDGRQLAELGAERTSSTNSLDFSPDGKLVALGGADAVVRLWDTTGWREVRRLTGHIGAVKSVAFAPDGHSLASGSQDGMVLLWAVK